MIDKCLGIKWSSKIHMQSYCKMPTLKCLLFVGFNALVLFFSAAQTSDVTRECTCSVSGDPHYKTFDGQMIHFMGSCKYILATNKYKKTRVNPIFIVEVKNEYRGTTAGTYTRMVDVKFENATVRLLSGHKVMVNSEVVSLPINDSSIFDATYASGWVSICTNWGFHLWFDGSHRVIVTLKNVTEGFSGICGDCNGKKDDMKTKDGIDVSNAENKYAKIGESYKVNDDSDKAETMCFVKDADEKCTSKMTEKCGIIKHHDIFSSCIKVLEASIVAEYYESCTIDVCAYLNNTKEIHSILCKSFEGFARECEKVGVTVNWRETTGCGLSCGVNEVYKYKALVCQSSCVDIHPTCTAYTEACVCKPGYILSNSGCVKKEKCGCSYNGRYMQINENFYDGQCSKKVMCVGNKKIEVKTFPPCKENSHCGTEEGIRKCVCNKGFHSYNGKCIPIQTHPCVCTGYGDPHYTLFDGQRITFAGICKYLMVQPKPGSRVTNFTVEVKNENRNNNKHYSYTRYIEVRFKTFNVKLIKDNKVTINGESVEPPVLTHQSFSLTKMSGSLKLVTNFGLTVTFDGKTKFEITLTPNFRNLLTGVCGDCNGKRDDYRTRAGQDVSSRAEKYNLVVNSYQVFDDALTPLHRCNKLP